MWARALLVVAGVSVVMALLASGAAGTASVRAEQAAGLRGQVPVGVKDARLDSRLAAVARVDVRRGSAPALDVARETGLRVEGGLIRAVVVSADGVAVGAAVRAAGGVVEARYEDEMQVLVPPGALDALSRLDGVGYVRPALTPRVESVTDEGVKAAGADVWHGAGREGAGVKVAVIDLGFAGYAARQAEGDLPQSLTTVDDCGGNFSTGEVHGTAVAEVVFDMAPAVDLTLICVDSEVTLGEAEQYAEAHGIRVVNHSVGWFNDVRGDGKGGPGTIDGIVADARAAGILWVNSAGNQAQSHWSGTFNDTNGDGFHDYTSADEGNSFLVPAGGDACVTLKWDAWPTTNQDFDLYVARSSDNTLVGFSENLQNGTQAPTEQTCFTNPSGFDDFFYVAIYRFAATATPRFDVFVFGGYQLQYQVAAGSLNELAASPNTLAAGAACWQSGALEPFSSRGPTIDNRIKPDISGPDGVSTATYGPFTSCTGDTGFFGTSAAAPHTAGAAALMLGQHPNLSVTQLQAALTGAAQDAGAAGKDNLYGAGRLRMPPIVAPKVTSFSPAAAPVGSTVTVTGSAFTGATSIGINGATTGSLTVVSPTKITTTVPAGATTGALTVTTPDGTGTSSGLFKVTPRIVSLSVPSAKRGDPVQLTGTTFTGATAVKFGAVAATTYTVDDDSHITVTVPPAATTGSLTVTTPAGTSNPVAFTVTLPPTITSFTPTAGPVGALITVSGSNLSTVTTATLGGQPATITPLSATQVKLTIPAGAASGQQITVTNPAGSTQSAGLFKVTPRIVSLSVSSAKRGDPVQLTGTTFTGATAVKFGAVAATTYTVDDDSHITVTVPPAATTGSLTVTTPAGTSNAVAFTVTLPPTITSFTPTAGPVGALITVSGSNLSTVTTATLGGQPATITPLSATQVKLTIPAGAASGQQITVTNPAGSTQSAGLFKVTPRIVSLSVPSAKRGDPVQLTGTTFTGATAVKFGAVAATTYTVDDDSHITVTVPPAATTGSLTVTTPAGTSNAVAFTVTLPPTITSFTPTAGPVGALITVSGSNLSTVTTATLGGQPATITPLSATQVKLTIPAGAASGQQITVTNPAGSTQSAGLFKVTPRIVSLSVPSAKRGDPVQLTGTTFTGATAVKFGAVAATTYTVDDDSHITVTVPPAATTGNLTVTTPAGTSNPVAFTVTLPPTITNLTPTSGATGSTVTITGANLGRVTSVTFNGLSSPHVTLVSATQLKAIVPNGATTGKIGVTGPGGTISSAANFVVAFGITDFTPKSGPVGTTVTITGVGFGRVTAMKFGDAGAGGSVDSGTQITTTVPDDASSGPIVISNGAVSVASPVPFTVTPPPNDAFAAAVPIDGLPFTAAADNRRATTEAGEPTACGLQRTLWYRFTPAADERVSADTAGSSFPDAELAIYRQTGTGLAGLEPVGCNGSGPSAFSVRGGTTYYVQVGAQSNGGGALELNARVAPPLNDDFATATLISSTPFDDTVDITGATTEPGEPNAQGSRTIWYSITPATDAVVIASHPIIPPDPMVPPTPCQLSSSQYFVAYRSDAQGFAGLIQLAISGWNNGSAYTLHAQAGKTYYFQGGQNGGLTASGCPPFVLNVREIPPPPNDDFADAIAFTSVPFSDSRDLTAATIEPGEPMPCGLSFTQSAWYKFTPTTSGDYGGNPGVNQVNVYTGTSLGDLTNVACSGWWGLGFHADAGTTYYLQYYGGGMRVDQIPPVAADFTYSPANPSTNDNVSFSYWNGGYIDPSVTGYAWDFGDGTTGTGSPASHKYAQDGDYTVKLTVFAQGGRSNTATKIVQVRTPATTRR